MDLATIALNGQITIPERILNYLNLQDGDSVLFEKEDGKIYIVNASNNILKSVQNQLKGEAGRAGFKSEEDVVEYIKKLRRTR